ncbi:MAG: hypothetical protein LBE24_10470 [Methylobacillus sp.]|nr:hypothetical protein [Methylobacillus sp.]
MQLNFHSVDAMMNYPRLSVLFREFSSKLEQLHTLYLDSVVGYSILHERLDSYQERIRVLLDNHEHAAKEFQDTCSIIYKNLSNRDVMPVSLSPVMKQGQMRERVESDGINTLLLGSQCIVSAYTYWEEYLRIEIGKAIGVLSQDATTGEETRKILNKHVTSDLWGDIRYIRNSIVHNNGVANAEISSCKLIKWFSPGQPIKLNYERMRMIFLEMARYRNKLHKMSLSPARKFYIPEV